jgi:hypothetical protein
MALIYWDGFDDYSVAQIGRYWQTVFNTVNITVAANGRNGTNNCRFNSGTNCMIGFTVGSVATGTVGFALRLGSAPTGGNGAVVTFWDGVANNSQLSVSLNTSGQFVAQRSGTGGTILGTSTFALNTGVYYYVEVQATISTTVGVVTVRVNGTTVLNLTAQNTQGTANASFTSVYLNDDAVNGNHGMSRYWGNVDVDDLYIDNAATFHGDCRVETVFATGVGFSNTFTPTGAAANWQCVSENPADDDTTYVAGTAAGNIDLYAFAAIATTTGAVQGVMQMMIARNDSAGTTTLGAECRSGTTNFVDAGQNVGSTTYNGYFLLRLVDPNTSAAWTIANVNAAQFGVNRIA